MYYSGESSIIQAALLHSGANWVPTHKCIYNIYCFEKQVNHTRSDNITCNAYLQRQQKLVLQYLFESAVANRKSRSALKLA